MKKTGIMNGKLSQLVAEMGHGQILVIADCGLPIDTGVMVVDLALSPGIPGVFDALRAVLGEFSVESLTVAQEMVLASPDFYEELKNLLASDEAVRDRPIDYVSHDQFKQLTAQASVVIRTGEWTPYANVMMTAGVPF